MKSLAKYVTNASTSVAVGSNLTYQDATSTCDISQSNGLIQIRHAGVYRVTATLTAVAGTTDPIQFSILADGNVVNGTQMTVTPTADANVHLSIDTLLTVKPSSMGVATLSINNTGALTTVSSATVLIIREG